MSQCCSVPGCKNEKPSQDANVSYYNIPTDIETKIKWMLKVFGNVDFKHHNSLICSEHFKKEDFEEVQAKDATFPQKKILKEKVVPSVKLKPQSPVSSKTVVVPNMVPMVPNMVPVVPNMVPVVPNVGNVGASPVGIIIYQYNIQDSNIQNSTLQNTIQTDNSIGKVQMKVKSVGQKKIKNKIEDKLKGKIHVLKADLRAEKHKCSLLQRKMKELRNKVDELHASTKETIILNHEANLAKLKTEDSGNFKLEDFLKTADVKLCG